MLPIWRVVSGASLWQGPHYGTWALQIFLKAHPHLLGGRVARLPGGLKIIHRLKTGRLLISTSSTIILGRWMTFIHPFVSESPYSTTMATWKPLRQVNVHGCWNHPWNAGLTRGVPVVISGLLTALEFVRSFIHSFVREFYILQLRTSLPARTLFVHEKPCQSCWKKRRTRCCATTDMVEVTRKTATTVQRVVHQLLWKKKNKNKKIIWEER